MNVFVQPIVFCGIFATNGFVQDYQTHQVVSDFECGDLLYGLQEPVRARYLLTIEQQICKTDNSFHYTEKSEKVESSFDVRSATQSTSLMPKPSIPPKRIVYCTADVYNKRLNLYESNKTELDKCYETYMKAKGLVKFGYDDKELKFLCKNAIGFTVSQGKKIRFLLDGLNMSAIALKEERLGLSFTSVELRYIYRHWKEFKEYVVFYEQGRRLKKAPWENDPQLWKKYDTHRQDKANRLKKEKVRPAPVIEDVYLDDSTEVGIDSGSDALVDSGVSVACSGSNPHKKLKNSGYQKKNSPSFHVTYE